MTLGMNHQVSSYSLINLISIISFILAADSSEEQELTVEDIKFLRRSSIGCSGIVIEEIDC